MAALRAERAGACRERREGRRVHPLGFAFEPVAPVEAALDEAVGRATGRDRLHDRVAAAVVGEVGAADDGERGAGLVRDRPTLDDDGLVVR